MNQHHRLLRKLQRKRLINSLLFYVIACGIVIVLLIPAGLAAGYLKLDLSFLLLPFLGYFTLRLISKQIGVTIFPAYGEVVAGILDGLALSFWAYFFFSRAQLFTRVPLLAGSRDFLENLAHISFYIIVIILGYTLLKLAGPVQLNFRRLVSPLFSAAGWLLSGLGLWRSLSVIAGSWHSLDGIGLVLFFACLVMAISRMGTYLSSSSHLLLSDSAQWLADKPREKFLGTVIIAIYFVFIREPLFQRFSTAYLVEWVLFCLLSWRIFTVVRDNLEKRYTAPLLDSGWQKHIQIVDDLADEDFNQLVLLQEDFVDSGSRRELLVQFSRMLVMNGRNEEEIAGMLQPMIEHSDRKMPWWAFGFVKRRILSRNRLNRILSLDNTLQKMNVIISA